MPDDVSTRPGRRPRVAVVVHGTARALETAAFHEVFAGAAGRVAGLPRFDLRVVSATPGVPVSLSGGASVTPTEGLEFAASADFVLVTPPVDVPEGCRRDVARTLRAARASGAVLLSADTGVFLLAGAGLLDGVTVTTHWTLADRFSRAYPDVPLSAESVFVDSAPIFTAAGATAALDLALHVVSRHYGAATANEIAQLMVSGPLRNGDHHQVVQRASRDPRRDEGIVQLLDWAVANLHEDLSLDRMARRTYMSRRSLTRRFRATTGATPYAWVLAQRMKLAKELLEDPSGLTVEDIAIQVGFGSSGALRQRFQRSEGCSPSEYRRRFGPMARTGA